LTLEASGRGQEARAYFQKAFVLAQRVEPVFQQTRLHALEQRLAGNDQ
jgi:hypothetical protein